MVTKEKALIYSEVYGILNSMDVKYTNSIPKKLYNFIEEHREKDINKSYDLNIPLKEQKISKRAIAFICMLHLKYWCESEEEKQNIINILEYNEKKNREKFFKYETEVFKKYPVPSKKNDESTDESKQTVALSVQNDDGFFKKIIDIIKGLFKKTI